MTEEHKEKIRKALTGKKASEEAKANMRGAKRKPWSEERKLLQAERNRQSAHKRTGLKRTEEQRQRMSNSQKTRGPESYDALRSPHSSDTKNKIKESIAKSKECGKWKPYVFTEEDTKKAIKASADKRRGSKMTEEQRKRMSENWNDKRGPRTDKHRLNLSLANRGERGSNWKGGKTGISKILRRGIHFKNWRQSVFMRDDWTCQKTKVRGEKLHPHHIFSFSDNESVRFEDWNGITLSEAAHREFHRVYGKTNNNIYQIESFLGKQLPFNHRAQLIAYETAVCIEEGILGDKSPSWSFIKK